MIYGMYLSATGVLTNSHRQDVISNNLANAETPGFKRDLAIFKQRRTEASERGVSPQGRSDPLEEPIGGGTLVSRTAIDFSAGDLESTNNPTDLAITGDGFFAVRDGGDIRLTRAGNFLIDKTGRLVTAGGGRPVLDTHRKPIVVASGPVEIGDDGTISQAGQPVAQIGTFDVADRGRLTKRPGGQFAINGESSLHSVDPSMRSGFLERSNVDPAIEITQMMDAQRQLEANANMIRYQDQSLGKLVSDVMKIG